MSRWKAAGLHSLISIGVALLAGSLIFFVWYPPPYFTVTGGSTLMLLIIGVDLVMGPMLTFAVFKSGKKGLRFDLYVIAILQLAAFCYGMRIIGLARPVFVVAAVDRFIVVDASALDDMDLAEGTRPEFQTRSWSGPRLVGAVPPETGKEALDIAISGMRGKDIDRFPRYYVPYAQVSAALLERSRPLGDLSKKSAQAAQLVRAFLSARGATEADYRSVPLQGRSESYAMMLSAKTGNPATALAIDPW